MTQQQTRRQVTVRGLKISAREYIRSTRYYSWSLKEDWKKDDEFVEWLAAAKAEDMLTPEQLADDKSLLYAWMYNGDTSWSDLTDNYGYDCEDDEGDSDGDGYDDWEIERTTYHKWVDQVTIHVEPLEDEPVPSDVVPIQVVTLLDVDEDGTVQQGD